MNGKHVLAHPDCASVLEWKSSPRGRDMGSTKGFCIAVAATLAPVLVFAAEPLVKSDSTGKQHTVQCKTAPESAKVTVSVPESTVVVKCQEGSKFDPDVSTRQVCENADCTKQEELNTLCPDASIVALENKDDASILPSKNNGDAPVTSGATLFIKTLPVARTVFFVRCKAPSKEREGAPACVVEVTVNQATQDQAGAGKVQVCAQPGGSITLSLPDKDSSVQFKCTEGFSLSPAEPKSVFKDDCKTEENLKDMTRTEATSGVGTPARPASAASSITYTLRADKKPPRKKLCYLCEKQAAAGKEAKPAENYCAIYVESSSRTKVSIILAQWALLLPCAVAVLPFL